MRVARPTQHYSLVEVVWDDASAQRHGWVEKSNDEDVEPSLALSVGFLIRETSDHIVIAQDTDSDGSHNGRSQIPRGMVKRIRIMRKPDASKVPKT